MKEKTAIEFLIDYLKTNFYLTDNSKEIFKQAKEIEKKQRRQMYMKGLKNYKYHQLLKSYYEDDI